VVQLFGILLAKIALSQPSEPHLAPSFILLAVAFTSACNVLIIDYVLFVPSHSDKALTAGVDLSFSSYSFTQ
jgi:hypothetical protein